MEDVNQGRHGQLVEIAVLKDALEVCKAEGRYEEALADAEAILARDGGDIAAMFEAADLYFMACEYDRSLVWINKILALAPEHIGARILMVRICILGGRAQEGLAVLERILESGEALTEEQRGRIEYTLDYFSFSDGAAELLQGYPRVRAFLAQAVRVEPEAWRAEGLPTKGKSAETIRERILDKNISLQEKVDMCNSFAGAYFAEGKLGEAELLLLTALEMDGRHADTLRNLSVLTLACGDRAGAIQYAARLPKADFCLLHLLREKA